MEACLNCSRSQKSNLSSNRSNRSSISSSSSSSSSGCRRHIRDCSSSRSGSTSSGSSSRRRLRRHRRRRTCDVLKQPTEAIEHTRTTVEVTKCFASNRQYMFYSETRLSWLSSLVIARVHCTFLSCRLHVYHSIAFHINKTEAS